MKTAQRHNPTKKVQKVIFPKIIGMMSGVFCADYAHGLLVLTYTDGTTEAANIAPSKWQELVDNGNQFSLVSYVQSFR